MGGQSGGPGLTSGLGKRRERRGFRSREWWGMGGSEVEGGVMQGLCVGMRGKVSPPPPPDPFPHPLTVEELRLDMEELLLSMRSNEESGPGFSSPFSSISDAA